METKILHSLYPVGKYFNAPHLPSPPLPGQKHVMNGPLLSSIIFDWPCWADWLISFIRNHYCKQRQLQQQKQNKRICF